jgi:branched-chain amino acid aminotransferase
VTRPDAPVTEVPASGPYRWAYHNGSVVALAEASLPLTTQALQYGTGVFEGIRAFLATSGDGLVLFRPRDHYQRFIRSCRLLRIEVPHTADELTAITVELLRRNGARADTYIRPLGYKLGLLPGTRPGVSLSGISDALSIVNFALGDYRPAGGLRCVVSTWVRPPHQAIPVQAKITGGYVNNALALDEARALGYDDAILLNTRGQVAEATTANVVIVRDGRLVTPPVSADVLAGITLDTVRVLAREELGLVTEERELLRADLLHADEVLLTGTGLGIAGVTEISGRRLGDQPGPATTALADAYHRVVRAEPNSHADWLVRVPFD